MEEIYNEGCLYKDTYTIIKMMDSNMSKKINPKFIQFLKENQDNEYESSIDTEKPLKLQQLREEVKIMLSIIYINYFCDEIKKEEILKKEKENIEEYNRKLCEDMFKDRRKENTNASTSLMIMPKENLIKRILKKLKNILIIKVSITELLNVCYNCMNTIDLLGKKNKIYISKKGLK